MSLLHLIAVISRINDDVSFKAQNDRLVVRALTTNTNLIRLYSQKEIETYFISNLSPGQLISFNLRGQEWKIEFRSESRVRELLHPWLFDLRSLALMLSDDIELPHILGENGWCAICSDAYKQKLKYQLQVIKK